jgi:hypothetical protein
MNLTSATAVPNKLFPHEKPVVVSLQLSGNDKLYNYVALAAQVVNRNVGDRVVVPNKLKDDGSLSLSIGTFKGIVQDASPEGLLPVVQFVDALYLREVQLKMLAKREEVKA